MKMFQSFNWKLLQQSMLKLDPTPTLIFYPYRINTTRWIFQAVIKGLILAPALADQKLDIHVTNWGGGCIYTQRIC